MEDKKRERVQVTEKTKLVELCDEEYAERGEFERSLAECFKGMSVKHLKGKDEAGWEAFVKVEGGPHGLVSGWLKEKGLRRFLDGYVSPTITKKAKSRGDESSSSHSSPQSVDDLLQKVLGRRSPEVTDVTLSSMDDVATYLAIAEENLTPRDNGVLVASSSPLLKVDVPLNTQGDPDLLRLPLPANFPCQQRADEVLQLLQQKHVLAAAVSGAGKTRLAFDLAQRQHALYFDMNGGHGKVRQMDVSGFFARCLHAAGYVNPQDTESRERALSVFDRVIAALILSRWTVLALAIRANGEGNLSPAQWLWMQTDNANLFDDSFIACLRLSDERQHELLGVLRTVVTPIVLLDEAQEMLKHDGCFRSKRSSTEKRPLGYRVVHWLDEHGLKCFVSGTNMRLNNFSLLRSAVGQGDSVGSQMWYNFDFLRLEDDGRGALLEYCCHVLEISGDDVGSAISSLQGRPRFAAWAIHEAIVAKAKTLEDFIASVKSYAETQIASNSNSTARGTWERLYQGKDVVNASGEPVLMWELGRNMLLQSIYEGDVKFATNVERELVSRGITMLDTRGEKEFMAEPLVLSAGLSFFLSAGVDIAAPLVARFRDATFTDPQHRGRVLELLAAARLFEKPNRLQLLPAWPATLELPSHPPRGVLVNVSLTDERVGFQHLDEKPGRNQDYWISLPEVHAGPDLVMPRLVVSFKSTMRGDAISASESRKSIKTTTPALFYTKDEGKLYDGGVWRAKHDVVVEQARAWARGIVRVRVELPAAAQSERPPEVIATEGKDTLVYLDSGNASVLLGEGLL